MHQFHYQILCLDLVQYEAKWTACSNLIFKQHGAFHLGTFEMRINKLERVNGGPIWFRIVIYIKPAINSLKLIQVFVK
jgi:hypothetical protein